MLRSAMPMPAKRRTTSGDIAAPPVIATFTRFNPSWSRRPRSTLHSATTLASRQRRGAALDAGEVHLLAGGQRPPDHLSPQPAGIDHAAEHARGEVLPL